MSTPTAANRLDFLIEQAVLDLQTATQGGSMCAISRSGKSAPVAKYLEGRWAALTEFRRLQRQSNPSVAALRDRWAADLDALIDRDADANWVAYTQGGVNALCEVLSG